MKVSSSSFSSFGEFKSDDSTNLFESDDKFLYIEAFPPSPSFLFTIIVIIFCD